MNPENPTYRQWDMIGCYLFTIPSRDCWAWSRSTDSWSIKPASSRTRGSWRSAAALGTWRSLSNAYILTPRWSGSIPTPKALACAQRKAGREALSVHLDRGFAEELPYPDASFDRVLSALMFHHLGPEEKAKTLGEARRVLKPGGSLYLLDFGGAKVRSDGFLTRLHHRSKRLRDNFGERIPTLMREAGFADPTEVAHRVTIAGRLTYYRASTPREGSDAQHSGI